MFSSLGVGDNNDSDDGNDWWSAAISTYLGDFNTLVRFRPICAISTDQCDFDQLVRFQQISAISTD